jgi:hypothetical protein
MGVNHINQNEGKTVEQQMRLRVRADIGALNLVPIGRDGAGGPLRWAWPGRGSITYGEVVRLCRARGWPRPELLPATVKHRIDDEPEETHGP